MPSIVIRLDPTQLADPDLDMRYEIPDLLAQRSGGLIADDGYEYETYDLDSPNALLIFLKTPNIESALPHVLSLIEKDRLCGNDLAPASIVGVSEQNAPEATEYRVVFPAGASPVLKVRS